MTRAIWTIVLLFSCSFACAQSVEYYAGHQRTGVDLMWFKNFHDGKENKTPFLFFSRNRASVDYKGSPGVFSSTNAVSYNFKTGIGLVAVAQFLNSGFVPKAGVQLFKQKGDFMFFGWLVSDLKKNGNIDLFGLFRYQPRIDSAWRWYGQAELFPVYTPYAGTWNLTERLRLGVKYHRWAVGGMIDLIQRGSALELGTQNIGGFLKYDF